MSNRKTVWVDVDEVMADFQGAVFPIIHEVTGRKMSKDDFDGTFWDMFSLITEDERKQVFAECSRPGFCANLEPVPGAREGLAELRKYADVYAVTAHFSSQTWVYERDWWLQRHMGFSRTDITHTSAKHLVKTDACLDDKPENVTKWHKAHPNGLAMLWPIPNTRKMPLDHYRVADWDDVVRRVVDHKVGG